MAGTHFKGPLYVNGLEVPTLSSDGSSLVSGDGNVALYLGDRALCPRGFPLVFAPRTTQVVASTNCTPANVSRTSPDGVLLNGVRMSPTSSTNCSMDFSITSSTITSGLVGFLMYCEPATAQQLLPTFFLSDGAGFSNYYSSNTAINQPGWYYFMPGKPADAVTKKWGVGGGSPSFGSTGFTRIRLRMDFTAATTPAIELYGIFEGARPAKSKIAFVADDGYSTQYTIAAPIFDRYKCPLTVGIIADLIGTANYMTLAQLQDLRARGHQITVHGPIGGTGSLLNYSGSADPQAAVTADVKFHRDYIVANNLQSDGSERCYVFPQGEFQFAVADTRIIDALKSLKFVGGRWVNSALWDNMRPVHGVDPFQQIYCAGHQWSVSNEAANISAIITRINEAAASGRDVVIMLHKFVTSTPTDVLEIQDTSLIQLIEAAARNSLAGTMELTTLSDILFAHAGQSLARRPYV